MRLVSIPTGLAIAIALAGTAATARADAVRLGDLLSDHALVQRDQPLTLAGTATPGALVSVSFAGRVVTAQADAAGRWRATTPPLPAGGPYDLTATDDAGHVQTARDMLVGDLWLCGGQSNMQMAVGAATNAWNETHVAANPRLRFVEIPREPSPVPLDRFKTRPTWRIAGPDTRGEASAACYYMAKALQASTGVPIGFVDADYGGSKAEAWIDETRLRRLKSYDDGLDRLDRYARTPTDPAWTAAPIPPWENSSAILASLYNGLIAPLAGTRFKGVAWYQGESNWEHPERYAGLLGEVIADWRETLGQPDLPFLIVQLPNFGPPAAQPGPSAWAALRDAQRRTALSTPHAGLTVTLDIGDRFDIHPTEKTVVGKRLALAARKVAYGEAVATSPDPVAVERRGPDLIVRFAETDGGLKTYGSDQALGFETCTADRVCRWATATASGQAVRLADANRPEVRFVRYAWAEAPFVNLYGGSDLPVGTFELEVP
jgi:sialate O-acetylesterase